MLTFLNRLVSSVRRLRGQLSLGNLTVRHSNFRNTGLRRFLLRSGRVLTFSNLIRWVGYITFSQAVLGLGAMVIIITLFAAQGAARDILESPTLTLPWDYLWIVFKWVWAVSSLWIVIVSVNHWTDLITLCLSMNPTNILDYISVFFGFYWVTVWDISVEFFRTLMTDPIHLGNTRAVVEIYLLVDHIGGLGSWLCDFFIRHTPLYFGEVIAAVKVWCTGTFSSMWGVTTSSVSWIWLHTVGLIQTGITPVVHPIVQPIVNSIAHGVASVIASSILMFILRLVFGWPF